MAETPRVQMALTARCACGHALFAHLGYVGDARELIGCGPCRDRGNPCAHFRLLNRKARRAGRAAR